MKKPPPDNIRPNFNNKEESNIRTKSRKERLENLLDTLENDLLVAEVAEDIRSATRIITIAGERFHPTIAEAQVFVPQLIENTKKMLKELE